MKPFPIFLGISALVFCALVCLDVYVDISFVWWMLFVIVFLSFIGIASFNMRYHFFHKAWITPDRPGQQIAITFDDGPHPNTTRVLKLLNEYNAKATFFMIGNHMKRYPDVATRVVAQGHTIGNHSYTHNPFFPFFGLRKISNEIDHTNRLIEKITNRKSTLFRPPFGVINPPVAKALTINSMELIGWNLRSYDTVRGHDVVIDRIVKRLKPGSVVLLHDNRIKCLEILEAVLQYSKKNDLECVTIDKLFNLNES